MERRWGHRNPRAESTGGRSVAHRRLGRASSRPFGVPLALGLVGLVAASSIWAMGVRDPLRVLAGLPAAPGTISTVGGGLPDCPSSGGVPPAALAIPLAGPNGTVPAGSVLGVAFEVRSDPFPGSVPGGVVEFPTVDFVFPTSPGGPIVVVLLSRQVNVSPTWSDPASASTSRTLPAPVGFASGGNATLSTALLAVMASSPPGSLRIEVRWEWTLTVPGSPPQGGTWSTSSPSGPGTLFPRPYVSLLRNSSSNATIGENYTISLSGSPPAQSFLLKLENATTGETLNLGSISPGSPANASQTGSVVLLTPSGFLVPGSYLVHIHDPCGAILYSLPISATYASRATVSVEVSPTSCGPVSFDHTPVSPGGSWSGAPGPEPRTASVPPCAAGSFLGWQRSGGVSISGGSGRTATVEVSAGGSLSAAFG